MHLTQSATCPIDRHTLVSSQLTPAMRIIYNLVNELEVACPNVQNGCEATVQRSLAQQHAEHECEALLIPCSVPKCPERVLKKDYNAHVMNCKYREVKCKFCKKLVIENELNVKCDKATLHVLTSHALCSCTSSRVSA
jgi:hypothetical protein